MADIIDQLISVGGGLGGNKNDYSTSNNYNVVSDYTWTLSNRLNKNTSGALNEVPYIFLTEHAVNESTITNQIAYYGSGTLGIGQDNTDPTLRPYDFLFPRNPTGNTYRFPYFSDVNFQIDTTWESLDSAEEGANGVQSFAGALIGDKKANAIGDTVKKIAKVGAFAVAATNSKVGVMDRPKLFSQHEFRTLNVKFPLFNTKDPDDWKKNRALCWVLINQNLFIKQSIMTGVPPVYYEAVIPGQHYSYAAYANNITINNRGNMHLLQDDKGNNVVVPDAYEVNITLKDMVMPSRNLFQHIDKATQQVTVRTASNSNSNPTTTNSKNGTNTYAKAETTKKTTV